MKNCIVRTYGKGYMNPITDLNGKLNDGWIVKSCTPINGNDGRTEYIEYILEKPDEKDVEIANNITDKCVYCMDGVALKNGPTNDIGIAISYPNHLMAYGYNVTGFGSNGISCNINYCPMCGRILKGEIHHE